MDGARTHPPSLRRERATRDRRPRRRRADLRRAPHARSRRPTPHTRAHGGPRAAGSRPRAARPPLRRHVTLDGLLGAGFALLAEEPGREIVLGIAGRFWRVTGGGMRVSATDFAAFSAPGTAKAAMDFRLEPLAGGPARALNRAPVL